MWYYDKILDHCKKENNSIKMEYIYSLNLNEKEFDNLLQFLQINKIEIVEELYQDEQKEELEKDYSESDITLSPLKMYLHEISKIPLLNSVDEKNLFIEYKNGSESARQKLINANLRLVISIAKKYSSSTTLDIMDYIQEGNAGLIKAIDRFDISKGCKLSTYATWWIRQSVSRAIVDEGKTIRIPSYMNILNNKIGRFINEFSIKNERKPSIKEISLNLNLDEEKVKFCLKDMGDSVSLNSLIGEEATLQDFVSDDNNIEENICQTLTIEEILKIMESVLTEREIKVILKRLGYADGREQSLREIGKSLNLTGQAVRQIEAKAWRKLKLALYRKGYKKETVLYLKNL